MSKRIYVTPREGLKVPDPAVKGTSRDVMLPPEGKWVDDSSYWRRRAKAVAGLEPEVVVGEPPTVATPGNTNELDETESAEAAEAAEDEELGKDGDA